MAENAPTLVLKLDRQDTSSLADLRTQPSLFAAETDEAVWLKAEEADKDLRPRLKALPAVRTYVLNGKLLFPENTAVPEAKIPSSIEWVPLQKWLQPEPPPSVLPPLELPTARLPFRLVRSQVEETVIALLVEAEQWRQYAATAPRVRLERLQFALSEERQVLVMGDPLPSLPGILYWRMERLLLPAGWTLEHPLLAPLLSRRMTEGPNDLALIQQSGTWSKVADGAFVGAQRANVRLSLKT